jgi:hypothetical protein
MKDAEKAEDTCGTRNLTKLLHKNNRLCLASDRHDIAILKITTSPAS